MFAVQTQPSGGVRREPAPLGPGRQHHRPGRCRLRRRRRRTRRGRRHHRPANDRCAGHHHPATGKAKTYSIRGMTITLRPEWNAEVDVDEGANVVTGRPCVHSDLLGSDLCPSFLVFGPDGIFHGYENGPYRLDQPYHPGTDVSPCQTAPDDGLEGAQTLVLSGLAKVGTKKANYREWRVTCVASSGNKPVGKPYVRGSGTCRSPRSWWSTSGPLRAWPKRSPTPAGISPRIRATLTRNARFRRSSFAEIRGMEWDGVAKRWSARGSPECAPSAPFVSRYRPGELPILRSTC